MAIFHLTTKPISRGKGQSAIAAAAYRSGERLRDEQANEQKFYAARADRIKFEGIFVPPDAPAWAHDRNELWNHAERAETRKDARLAREIEVALPHEMTDQQREYLIKDFVREQFSRKGYGADVAIHAPDKGDDRNYHAHILITERRLEADGFAAKKETTFNRPDQLEKWREDWAHLTNRHLERHGIDARVDHRSLKEQGIEREPTVHVGYAGMEMDARGAQSDRMDALKAVIERNDIRVEIKALDAEFAELVRAQSRGQQPDGLLEWTQRGGMVAQQQSALESFNRTAKPASPAPASDIVAEDYLKKLRDILEAPTIEPEVKKPDPENDRGGGWSR